MSAPPRFFASIASLALPNGADCPIFVNWRRCVLA
jgi:hypothetical protein